MFACAWLLILAGFVILMAFLGNLLLTIVGSLLLVSGASVVVYQRRDNLSAFGFFAAFGISVLALVRAVGGGGLAAILGGIAIALLAVLMLLPVRKTVR